MKFIVRFVSKSRVWIHMAMLVIALLSGMAAAQENPPAKPAADAKIKLGVIVSYYTATGPHWIQNPYGYKEQIRRIPEIKDARIEIIPVIEPGTELKGEMPSILKDFFPGKTPVNGYDPDALGKLDVVMAHMIFNMQPEMSDALLKAVNSGMGYVQQSGGAVNPGYTDANTQLAGMTSAEYGWNPQDVDCEIVGEHPLLGRLSGDKKAIISLRPNGHFGLLKNGTPLIKVSARKDIYVPRRRTVDADFYPLYVAQLGKGRIVGIGFAHYQPTPDDLQDATDFRFFTRCVQWAAGREPEPLP